MILYYRCTIGTHDLFQAFFRTRMMELIALVWLYFKFISVCLGEFQLNQIICEDDTKIIRCEAGRVIDIQDVNHGRNAFDQCPHPVTGIFECSSATSLTRVKTLCNGKQSCVLVASSLVFGVPCFGAYRYMEVAYTCGRASFQIFPHFNFRLKTDEVYPSNVEGHKEEIICEHDRKTISCDSGSVLSIVDANYGRLDYKHCPHYSIKTVKCSSGSSRARVYELCNGKPACTLVATNLVFGDPCTGTYKYLKVEYKCGTPSFTKAPQLNSKVICEHPWTTGLENKCYFFSNKKESWYQAQVSCHLMGGNVAILHNEAEKHWMQLATAGLHKGNFWVAGNDLSELGHWQWYPTKETLPTEILNPDLIYSDVLERCLLLCPETFLPADCSSLQYFVCTKGDKLEPECKK